LTDQKNLKSIVVRLSYSPARPIKGEEMSKTFDTQTDQAREQVRTVLDGAAEIVDLLEELVDVANFKPEEAPNNVTTVKTYLSSIMPAYTTTSDHLGSICTLWPKELKMLSMKPFSTVSVKRFQDELLGLTNVIALQLMSGQKISANFWNDDDVKDLIENIHKQLVRSKIFPNEVIALFLTKYAVTGYQLENQDQNKRTMQIDSLQYISTLLHDTHGPRGVTPYQVYLIGQLIKTYRYLYPSFGKG
jgi:hypothetical protein